MEEWNEYGELRDHVGDMSSAVPATPTPSAAPSASNTPSKPPPAPIVSSKSTDTASPKPFSSNTDASSTETGSTTAPMNLAMRSIGFEAAKKAGDVKIARLKAAARPSESSDPATDSLKKVDNSARFPPPSGTTEVSSVKASETGESTIESKADPTSEIAVLSTASLQATLPQQPIKHRGSSISFADPEVIRRVEKSSAIAEEPEEKEGEVTTKTEDATATDEAKQLPGTKTQKQSATGRGRLEESVTD